jgi:hypothetical protein
MQLTMADALPIVEVLRKAGYAPQVVGSVADKGISDNDIDIVLPVILGRDNSHTIKRGIILRDGVALLAYYRAMQSLGFILAVAPPFAAIDTWCKSEARVDIWFQEV